MGRMKKRSIAALAAGMTVAVGAPVALGNPGNTQYSNRAGAVVKETPKSVAKAQGAVASAPKGTLPFTGLDLTIVLGAGGLALATGVALRRAGRENS